MAGKFWTPQEWDRIVRVAKEERNFRAIARTFDGTLKPVTKQAARELADSSALELRQWARNADFMAPVPADQFYRRVDAAMLADKAVDGYQTRKDAVGLELEQRADAARRAGL